MAGHLKSCHIYIGGTLELGEGGEGWVLYGVHTPFSYIVQFLRYPWATDSFCKRGERTPRKGERGARYRYIRGTIEPGEGAEGWVLPGVHTPFSHKYIYGA